VSSRDALHERLGGGHRCFSEHVYGAPREFAQQVFQRVAGGRGLRRLEAETVMRTSGPRCGRDREHAQVSEPVRRLFSGDLCNVSAVHQRADDAHLGVVLQAEVDM